MGSALAIEALLVRFSVSIHLHFLATTEHNGDCFITDCSLCAEEAACEANNAFGDLLVFRCDCPSTHDGDGITCTLREVDNPCK